MVCGIVDHYLFLVNGFFLANWKVFGGSEKGNLLGKMPSVAILWVTWEERNRRILSDKFSLVGVPIVYSDIICGMRKWIKEWDE